MGIVKNYWYISYKLAVEYNLTIINVVTFSYDMIIIYAKDHSTNTFLVNYPSKVSKTDGLQRNTVRFKD